MPFLLMEMWREASVCNSGTDDVGRTVGALLFVAETAGRARALALDVAKDWTPTVDSYLGRVTKAHIVEAVTEGVSEDAARRIADMKKPDMAQAAEQLLAGTGWLLISAEN